MNRRQQLLLFVLLFLLSCNFQNNNNNLVVDATTPNNHNNNNNAYQVLGVNDKCTQEEISKQYRKLCLKYHPDKNTHKPQKEREHCIEKFKSLQQAYELIGTPEARTKYRYSSRYETKTYSRYRSSRQHHPDPFVDAFYQAYKQGQRFSSNGNGGFRFYTFSGPAGFGYGNGRQRQQSPFTTSYSEGGISSFLGQFKPIYKEKIVIPLDVLYEGTKEYEFILKDKWWKRWRAAIQSKYIYLSIYQGLIYALPMLKASKFLAVITAGIIVHATLPKPSDENNIQATHNLDFSRNDEEVLSSSSNHYVYKHSIKRGTKGNNNYENNNINTNNNNNPTRIIKFKSSSSSKTGGFAFNDNAPDIIFEIYEQDHPIYRRIGDNLHTTIEISTKEFRNGCIKYIPHIIATRGRGGENNNPIEIHIPPSSTKTNSNKATSSRGVGDKENQKKKKKTSTTKTRNSSTTTSSYDKNNHYNTLIIKGKGWPIQQRNSSYGDLIVHIKVIDDNNKDDVRIRKKKQRRKGKHYHKKRKKSNE